jgi:hypothetical protein
MGHTNFAGGIILIIVVFLSFCLPPSTAVDRHHGDYVYFANTWQNYWKMSTMAATNFQLPNKNKEFQVQLLSYCIDYKLYTSWAIML